MLYDLFLKNDISFEEISNAVSEFLAPWHQGNFNPEDSNLINVYYMSELIKPCEHRHWERSGNFAKFYHYSFVLAPLKAYITKYFDIVDADSGKPYDLISGSISTKDIFIQLFNVTENSANLYVKKLLYEDLEYFIFHRSHKDFEFDILNLTLRFL